MPLAVIATTTTPAQAHPGGTARAVSAGPGSAPTVNWALSGTASATNAESGEPASNAIDGDAGTDVGEFRTFGPDPAASGLDLGADLLSFVTDELSILAQVPDGLGGGLFYWAPDWIPGVPWEPGTGVGSPNTNLTLFNFEGAALPSIGIFQNPAGVCERYSPGSSPCVVGG
jgi:Glycosyl hydrolase family 53